MKIRKMSPEDKAQVMKIIEDTAMFSKQEIAVAEELVDIFLKNKEQKDYDVYVADDNGVVTGYVCFGPILVTDGTYDLYWTAVSPDKQKKGVGKKLLAFVEEEVVRQGGRMMIIETSSREKYLPTQEFYRKNSYCLEARIKDFYSPGDDRMIFVKRFQVDI